MENHKLGGYTVPRLITGKSTFEKNSRSVDSKFWIGGTVASHETMQVLINKARSCKLCYKNTGHVRDFSYRHRIAAGNVIGEIASRLLLKEL